VIRETKRRKWSPANLPLVAALAAAAGRIPRISRFYGPRQRPPRTSREEPR